MKKITHIIIIASALFAILGIPALCNASQIAGIFKDKTDAVSSASVEIPDQPSGEYFVFINKDLHKDTLDEWEAFFNEEPVGVIFEDINCMVMDSDGLGIELAERYMARLPGNQMRLEKEEAMMATSKLQWGRCDIFVVSSEMAGNMNFNTIDNSTMEKITVRSN